MVSLATTAIAVAATIATATPAPMRDISRKKPACSKSDCATICTRFANSITTRMGVTVGGTGAAEDAKRRFQNDDRRAQAECPRHDVVGKRVDENIAQRERTAARDRSHVGLKELYKVVGKAAQLRRHRATA